MHHYIRVRVGKFNLRAKMARMCCAVPRFLIRKMWPNSTSLAWSDIDFLSGHNDLHQTSGTDACNIRSSQEEYYPYPSHTNYVDTKRHSSYCDCYCSLCTEQYQSSVVGGGGGEQLAPMDGVVPTTNPDALTPTIKGTNSSTTITSSYPSKVSPCRALFAASTIDRRQPQSYNSNGNHKSPLYFQCASRCNCCDTLSKHYHKEADINCYVEYSKMANNGSDNLNNKDITNYYCGGGGYHDTQTYSSNRTGQPISSTSLFDGTFIDRAHYLANKEQHQQHLCHRHKKTATRCEKHFSIGKMEDTFVSLISDEDEDVMIVELDDDDDDDLEDGSEEDVDDDEDDDDDDVDEDEDDDEDTDDITLNLNYLH